jgi:hypothetical protein
MLDFLTKLFNWFSPKKEEKKGHVCHPAMRRRRGRPRKDRR